jgi:hypothetical protein
LTSTVLAIEQSTYSTLTKLSLSLFSFIKDFDQASSSVLLGGFVIKSSAPAWYQIVCDDVFSFKIHFFVLKC